MERGRSFGASPFRFKGVPLADFNTVQTIYLIVVFLTFTAIGTAALYFDKDK